MKYQACHQLSHRSKFKEYVLYSADFYEISFFVLVFPQELLVNAVSRRLGQGHC